MAVRAKRAAFGSVSAKSAQAGMPVLLKSRYVRVRDFVYGDLIWTLRNFYN